ncbi:ABC-three component system middle component 1 [Pseudomonas moraviensis]|uniref:ABC-three component system middle component 1 n=1 Tax=Pseudomonas moraviensis TaxID=321662 RepID=UPI00211CA14E|nr:ABC-three component system middle component 1 [Pseudomonas moraviensis]
MLKQIVSQALGAHDFKLVRADDVSEYYMREIAESIRFAVIHEIEGVTTPSELNVRILQAAPEEFSQHPAFKKNCDLICILKFGSLSEFKDLEQKIFAIEEDAYHFKKYVLYYSDIEEQMLDDVSYEVLFDVISEKKEFDAYKANPLSSSNTALPHEFLLSCHFWSCLIKKRNLSRWGSR